MTSNRTAEDAPVTAAPDLPDVFSPQWCWARLAAAPEGMLTFALPRGMIAIPVPYALSRGQIIIALAPTNTTGWRAAGGPAALVITGTAGQRRWVVRASGQAGRARAGDHDARLLASSLDRPRLRSDPTPDQLVLTSVEVEGCCAGR